MLLEICGLKNRVITRNRCGIGCALWAARDPHVRSIITVAQVAACFTYRTGGSLTSSPSSPSLPHRGRRESFPDFFVPNDGSKLAQGWDKWKCARCTSIGLLVWQAASKGSILASVYCEPKSCMQRTAALCRRSTLFKVAQLIRHILRQTDVCANSRQDDGTHVWNQSATWNIHAGRILAPSSSIEKFASAQTLSPNRESGKRSARDDRKHREIIS